VFGATAVVDPPPARSPRRTSARRSSLGSRARAATPSAWSSSRVARPPFGSGHSSCEAPPRATARSSSTACRCPPLPLGGLTSFINSRLLSEINLYPGNSPAVRAPRGAILEVDSRDPRTDAFHGAVEFSASMPGSSPRARSRQLRHRGGFRRSLIDLVFEYVVPADTIQTTKLPSTTTTSFTTCARRADKTASTSTARRSPAARRRRAPRRRSGDPWRREPRHAVQLHAASWYTSTTGTRPRRPAPLRPHRSEVQPRNELSFDAQFTKSTGAPSGTRG